MGWKLNNQYNFITETSYKVIQETGHKTSHKS